MSEGCRFCYAEAASGRNPAVLGVWGPPPKGTRVVASEAKWKEPLKWDRWAREGVCYHCHGQSTKPTPGRCEVCDGTGNLGPYRARVFCASIADIFEDWTGDLIDAKGRVLHYNSAATWWVPEASIHGPIPLSFVRARVASLIGTTPNLDWLLLTKRPENAGRMLAEMFEVGPLPPNLWVGTTCEDQENAARRIPELLKVPAAVRFLSVEPLIGPVDLTKVPRPDNAYFTWRGETGAIGPRSEPDDYVYECKRGISWVIVGGESGPHARPCDVAWIRAIVRQCQDAGVSCFVKQLGSRPVQSTNVNGDIVSLGYPLIGRLKDPKGGDPEEWSGELRVREFPAGVAR